MVKEVVFDEHSLRMFGFDLARRIFEKDEIAKRWGFVDEPHMRAWLALHPEFVKDVLELRRLNDADENVLDRVQHKSAHATEHIIPNLVAIVTDPNTSAKDKIDAGNLIAKMGGSLTHAQPKTPTTGGGGGQVTNFAIYFQGAKPKSFSTTVVPSNAIPDLGGQTIDVPVDDEDA